MKVKQALITSLVAATVLILRTAVPSVASAASNKPIIVGSKNVSESKTVSEIYALALEHEGYKVTRKPNIANNVIFQATQRARSTFTLTILGQSLKPTSKSGPAARAPVKLPRLPIKGFKRMV